MKIGLDAGHCLSGSDTGAIGCGMREELITRAITNEVSKQLQALGHNVVICNIDKANSVRYSLNHRCNVANDTNVDLFVSIHVNSGGGTGSEAFTYGGKELPEAQRVLTNLNSLGYRNRGIKDGSKLAVINGTKMKSMLVEVCFIDNPLDVDLYKKLGATKLANAIVSGILNRSMDSNIPSQPQETKGKTYTVQVGAYKDKKNAEEQLNKLKKNGFNGFIKEK